MVATTDEQERAGANTNTGENRLGSRGRTLMLANLKLASPLRVADVDVSP
jgi:hypothetical protein